VHGDHPSQALNAREGRLDPTRWARQLPYHAGHRRQEITHKPRRAGVQVPAPLTMRSQGLANLLPQRLVQTKFRDAVSTSRRCSPDPPPPEQAHAVDTVHESSRGLVTREVRGLSGQASRSDLADLPGEPSHDAAFSCKPHPQVLHGGRFHRTNTTSLTRVPTRTSPRWERRTVSCSSASH